MESTSLGLLMTRCGFMVLKRASAVGRKTWSKWAPATHLWEPLWEPLDPAVAQLASRARTRVFIKGDWLILKAVRLRAEHKIIFS